MRPMRRSSSSRASSCCGSAPGGGGGGGGICQAAIGALEWGGGTVAGGGLRRRAHASSANSRQRIRPTTMAIRLRTTMAPNLTPGPKVKAGWLKELARARPVTMYSAASGTVSFPTHMPLTLLISYEELHEGLLGTARRVRAERTV